MWYLTSDSDKRVIYVQENKNIIVGRSLDGQNCNFAIPDDPSISRKHATLFIKDGCLYVKDVGSKYGTFINNSEKVEPDHVKILNCNDIIKFGKLGCVWKACKIDFITCSSTLKGENLLNLKNILNKLGGILKNDWDDTCIYLTMPAITLTIKVVLALVQNSNIVTVDYWNKCLEAISNNTPLPNVGNFVPHILESTLNKENVSFLPDTSRSTIFAGKKFIFFSRRQLEMYKTVLTKSSATPMLLSETKMTKSGLCENNVIVIQYNLSNTSQETQSQRDQIREIIDFLKSKGKRVVADAEIGLAVLYCSINKYCNPDFNYSSEVMKQAPIQTKSNNILAVESQETSQNICKRENISIDESLTSKQDVSLSQSTDNVSMKRKFNEDCDDTNGLKRKRLNLSLTKKRTLEDMEVEKPAKKMALQNIADDEDMFNFTKTVPAVTEDNKTKKLNFSKPLKRKHSVDGDEEDLFNFVNDEKTADKSNDIQEHNTNSVQTKPADEKISQNLDINAMRGSKLVELEKLNAGLDLKKVKKEDISEIDEKLSNVDIGCTTLIVRNDLIVKREPLQVKCSDNGIKNFKKFKKVWPVKMHITVVTNSEIFSTDYSTCNPSQVAS
nr:nibrin isoform X1 [Danaus plexippus plexippus]XP_032521206.1 nibrin isoform X2 [Danaus plexippus plexippus]